MLPQMACGAKSLYSDRLVEAARGDLDLLSFTQVRFLYYFNFIVPLPCRYDPSVVLFLVGALEAIRAWRA